MSEIDFARAQAAARAMLSAMRRSWVSEFPDRDCPIGDWDSLDTRGKRFFMRAAMAALRARPVPEHERKFEE